MTEIKAPALSPDKEPIQDRNKICDPVGRKEPQSQEKEADADKTKQHVNEKHKLQPTEKYENTLNDAKHCKII
jgi:hypothetical protein